MKNDHINITLMTLGTPMDRRRSFVYSGHHSNTYSIPEQQAAIHQRLLDILRCALSLGNRYSLPNRHGANV
jgi:hypothetical protein